MKQLKYIAQYQKDRNWGQNNFVVTLAKKDILRIKRMSPETTAYKKTVVSVAGYSRAKTKCSSLTAVLK